MKVVVTGGAGKLGQYVIRELVGLGYEVLCVDTTQPTPNACPSITADLRQSIELPAVFDGAGGVVHLARCPFPYIDFGFDASTRSWSAPDIPGDAEKFNLNIAMTYNVLAVSFASGVKKFVSGSSLAVYGLYYPMRPWHPVYLPVDEKHPLRPQDPYGLTKLLGEEICDAFARKGDMQIASLRFAGVSTDETFRTLLEKRKNPLRWLGGLWSYIDARDAAVACRLALESDFGGHETFNICAPTTHMNAPTHDLIRQYLPEVEQIKADLKGNWSGYDSAKAQKKLGFRARYLLEA